MTTRAPVLVALLGGLAACGANPELSRSVQELNVQVRELKGSVENLHVQMEGLDNRVTLLTDRLERVEISAGRAGAATATPALPVIHLERESDRGAPPPADEGAYATGDVGASEADEPAPATDREASRPSSWTGESGTLGVWEPSAPPLGRDEGLPAMPRKEARAKKGSITATPATGRADGDVPADLVTERRAPGERPATAPEASPPPVDPGVAVPRPKVDGRDPMALYKEGYRAVTTGSRAEGRELLFSFLLKYPRHELADNALYWIGESYYAEEAFSDALRYFQRIIDEYPDSNKVPDAMVKAAITLQRAGEPDQGRFLMKQVIKVYPGTQSAEVARQKLAEWTEGSQP